MKFLTILGIGLGVGMLGGLLIVWFGRRHGTLDESKASDPSAIMDDR